MGISSPAAIALVAAVALLPWVLGTRRTGARALPFEVAVVLAVLLLFVFTRLPNGNLWDALLDPWLWAVLHVYWLAFTAGRIGRLIRAS